MSSFDGHFPLGRGGRMRAFVSSEDADQAAPEAGGDLREFLHVTDLDLAMGDVAMFQIGREVGVSGDARHSNVVLFQQIA